MEGHIESVWEREGPDREGRGPAEAASAKLVKLKKTKYYCYKGGRPGVYIAARDRAVRAGISTSGEAVSGCGGP